MNPVEDSKARPIVDDTLRRALGPRPDVEKVIAELAEVYLGDAFRRLRTVRMQVVEGNIEGVRRFAHAMKGSSLSFGACRVASVAADLESEADAGILTMASTVARLELLAAELETVRREVSVPATTPAGGER